VIIFFNGASSSGKTSLARALQATWNGPLLYWSLDQVISQLPFSYGIGGENSAKGFEEIESEIFSREHGYVLNELSALYVETLAKSGYDIVIDYVLLDENMLQPFIDHLSDLEVCFVGITCDEDILAKRNFARHDRVPGLSVTQQSKIHFCRSFYNLELNSSRMTSEELADQVFDHIGTSSITRGIV
jgi:chloramphenicol 3-O phosphotransferase